MTTLQHEELRDDSQLKTPPTGRDFDVYRLVKVERKSTREAAKLLRISQTRVCQVVARVAGYMVDVTEPEDDARREKQLAVARQVAAEEINYCKDRALLSFDSRRTLRTVKEIKDAEGKVTSVTFHRESVNESRFLLTVARLAIIGSKLPGCTLPIACRQTFDEDGTEFDGDVIDAGVIEEEIAAAVPVANAELINPSEEACSAEASEPEITATDKSSGTVANDSKEITCDEPIESSTSPKVEISRPVHPAIALPPPTLLDELARTGVLKQMAIELSPLARAAMGIE